MRKRVELIGVVAATGAAALAVGLAARGGASSSSLVASWKPTASPATRWKEMS